MRLSQFGEQSKETKSEKLQEEDIRKTYDQLKDLSQDDLSRRLFEEVTKAKSNGTFDYEKLSSSVESMRAFLPSQTYENMKRMLQSLK